MKKLSLCIKNYALCIIMRLKWATSAKTYQADAFIAKNSNGISVEIKGVTGRYLGRQIRAVSE